MYLRGFDLFNPYAWVVTYLRFKSKPVRPPLPSIGIGNLRMGGTGKTPLVAKIVEFLPSPAIVTLGYRKKRKGCFTSEEHPEQEYLGDEGYMLYKKTGVPVIACKDRLKGAEMAKALGAKVVVFDDVFQNFGVRPDISILLLRPSDVHAHTVPFGPLREPFQAYRFADILVFNFKLDPPTPPPDLGKPTYYMRYSVKGISERGNIFPVEGRRIYAFCAIADPNSFFEAIRRSGGNVVGKKMYPDHWWISDRDLDEIKRKAEKLNAIPLCTEKDYYRLEREDLAYLKIDVDVDEALFQDVMHRLQNIFSSL